MSKLWRTVKRIFLWSVALFFGLSIFFTVLYRWVNPPVTPLMIIRLFNQYGKDKPLTLKKDWVALKDISPSMVQAVIASEDNLFLQHHGFDWSAIDKARTRNKNKKRRIHGGSTITQQTAKNVFLYPRRSYIRKGLEAYFTVLMEFFWSKERIIEVYLNVIEMGDGIYGIEQAAQTYYNRPAMRLTKRQSAMIAVILPDPRHRNPSHPSAYMIKRQATILNLMDRIGDVTFQRQTVKPM
ncbi:MAG: monofunctional biosynthetic peptidoglycan transglycosylase [Bacteroidales bacterium]|jgi:monofunctional biosynthetic peptidoglycan transglycosylase|nr:monofunctional biosynthetic peptidoglycan transglycosylase [Bacteroidales bacterium]